MPPEQQSAVEAGLLGALGGVPTKPADPLAVSYPSPMTFLQYPLLATNVRMLSGKGSKQSRGQLAWSSMVKSLRLTFRDEGMIGLYRGGHLFLLHQAVRDTIRLVTDRTLRIVEGRNAELGDKEAEVQSQKRYRRRLLAKYMIDALTYPILLASTRSVILHDDPQSTWQHMCGWCRQEGVLTLFSGMAASLLSTALDEIMDNVLAACIEYCSAGNDVEVTDKVMLKASGSSVVSILTAPINYIGVIQRCQSRLPGMLEPEPFPELVQSLPWRSCGLQFLLFGGIMAVNVKLIQMKVQLQEEQQERDDRE